MQETFTFHIPSLNQQALLNLAQAFAQREGTILLLSGGNYSSSEYSWMGLFPLETLTLARGQLTHWRYHAPTFRSLVSSPWQTLKYYLTIDSSVKNSLHFPEWMGFCGYEMGAWSDPDKHLTLAQSETPDAYFQRSAIQIVYEHLTHSAYVKINKSWFKQQSDLPYACMTSEGFLNWLKNLPHHQTNKSSLKGKCLEPPPSLEHYCHQVKEAKEWIYAGDCYQINLSHRSFWKSPYEPFQVFSRLHTLNPAPFSAYMHFPFATIVSSSPERLLLHRSKRLETRPIKGTAARGKNEAEDQALLNALLDSPKERAELMMITDLMRHDLGKVSEFGSIAVEHLQSVEAFQNVFHLHSLIISKPLPQFHPVELLQALFPGGSVTGCPKLSAIEAINSLEQRARGIYTGSIGYISSNGAFDFNIAIRTLVYQNGKWNMQVGGAIIADSDPKNEYEETLHKCKSMLYALGNSIFIKSF